MGESFFSKLKSQKTDLTVKTIEENRICEWLENQKNHSLPFSVHMCFFELPNKNSLNILADCSVNFAPNAETLVNIINQTIEVFSILCSDKPKVAILSANEKVSPKVLSTELANEAAKAFSDDSIAIVEGPVSFDLAISSQSAEIKKYKGKIHGDANIFIAPRVDTANSLMQSIKFIIKAKTAEIIMSDSPMAVLTKNANAQESNENSIIIAQILERKPSNV